VAALAVVLCGVFVPLINAPVMGLVSIRPPVALRAKVMTALMTASGLGGPAGRIVIGPLYRVAGNSGVWIEIAGGMTLGAVLFVGTVLRFSRSDAADVVAVPAVPNG
jgi:hypothetical protein